MANIRTRQFGAATGLLLSVALQAACSAAPDASDADLSRGLTAYLPLDGALTPRYATGSREMRGLKSPQFVEGKVGQALHIEGEGIGLPGLGNLSRPAGSVAFWVRPAWTPAQSDSPAQHSFLRAVNFELNYWGKTKKFVFMTGDSKPENGFAWDYGTADEKVLPRWKAGQWHHVAATWDIASGHKALYLDGERVASHQTELMRRKSNLFQTEAVTLGSQRTPGDYDEWMLWNRVLQPAEIAQLARNPAPVARMLQTALPRGTGEATWPVEFSTHVFKDAAQTIVAPGQTFRAPVPVENASQRTFEGELTFELLDFHERARATQKLKLKLAPGEKRALEIAFAPPENGPFKIAVKLDNGGQTLERDVCAFAAWPIPQGAPDPQSFFGNHVNSWDKSHIARAVRLGESWERIGSMTQSTQWMRTQPEPGAPTWERDFQLENQLAFNRPILGSLFGTPYWAVADGSGKKGVNTWAAVPDLDAWRQYVRDVVTRHQETIDHWEMGNEPNASNFWAGTPAQWVELARVAHEEIKRANPNAVVVLGGFVPNNWQWIEAMAQAGGLKYCDAISYHNYWNADDAPERTLDSRRKTKERFDAICQANIGRTLPLWDTESGVGNTTWLRGVDWRGLPPLAARTPLNWHRAAISVVQTSAIFQALGLKRSFYYLENAYNLSPQGYFSVSCIEPTEAPRPLLMARVAMQEQVRDCQYVEMVRRDEGRLWANVYRVSNGQTLVLWWAGENGRVRVSAAQLGKVVRVADLFANAQPIGAALEVGEEPSYVEVADSPAHVVAALQKLQVETVRAPAALPVKIATPDKPDIPDDLPDYAAPKEDPGKVFTVDLRRFANMGFADDAAGDGKGGWTDEGPSNDLDGMTTGQQTFYGVPFDVVDPAQNDGRAVITLFGAHTASKLPVEVTGIPINTTARVLYFLQSSNYEKLGQATAKYVIHYADGQTLEVPVVSGENVRDWWSGYQKRGDRKRSADGTGATYARDEASLPVPVRVEHAMNKDGPGWRYVRAWEWVNPRRQVPIRSVDFVSAQTEAAPVLLAISGVRG